MRNCRGCGSLLDLRRAETARGVCPRCGQAIAARIFHRRSVQLSLLAGLLVVASVLALASLDPEVHTQAAAAPEHVRTGVPPARWNGRFPCVWAVAAPGSAPRVGDCEPSVPIASLRAGPIDRFEVDLRFGRFILRQ